MTTEFQLLTDEQWQNLEPLFPNPPKRGRGKPHASWRAVLNSILMVLLMKVKWSAIPKTADFATKSVSHRWFVLWEKNGLLNQILERVNGHIAFPARRMRYPKPALAAI